MLYKVDNLPHTAASQLPNKSFVWQKIGGYLSPAQCAHMQGVSKHFYNFLTPNRLCQSKLEIGGIYAFTFPYAPKFAKSVMLYNGFTHEARLIKNKCFDMKNSKSVLVNNALIVFKEGKPVVAQKYTCFDDPANTVMSRLPTKPSKDFKQSFSVCKLANNSQIILSGGTNEIIDRVTAKVHALDTFRWKWKRLADLNIARSSHSSTSLGEATYVTCGWGSSTKLNSVERLSTVSGSAKSQAWTTMLNSVERLSMVSGSAKSQAWTIIEIPQLAPRSVPVFSQIGPDQLCIMGGQGYQTQQMVILNVKTQEVTVEACQLVCSCLSESFMEKKQGQLLCLVLDMSWNVRLIRFNYNQATFNSTDIHNYGSKFKK